MARSENLVLTGFMATGKTTVGRLVAERLGMGFVDTDLVIEERHGPIPRIFEERGEPGFRAIERELAAELADRAGLVIAVGGGMLLDPLNLDLLGRNGHIFCLVAGSEEIHRRVTVGQDPPQRPLLVGDDALGRIVELLAERAPAYAQFTQVVTDGLEPDQVVDRLALLWEAATTT